MNQSEENSIYRIALATIGGSVMFAGLIGLVYSIGFLFE